MLTILSNFNHAGHVKRRWGEITGIIVTVTTLQWSDIFTKVTKCIIVLKISIAKARLFSHQSDKLYDVSTQSISSQPNLPPSIRVEGRGGEEGWVATGSRVISSMPGKGSSYTRASFQILDKFFAENKRGKWIEKNFSVFTFVKKWYKP